MIDKLLEFALYLSSILNEINWRTGGRYAGIIGHIGQKLHRIGNLRYKP
jgi:hypothetical protein